MKCDEISKCDEVKWCEIKWWNVMKCDEMKNVMKWSGAKLTGWNVMKCDEIENRMKWWSDEMWWNGWSGWNGRRDEMDEIWWNRRRNEITNYNNNMTNAQTLYYRLSTTHFFLIFMHACRAQYLGVPAPPQRSPVCCQKVNPSSNSNAGRGASARASVETLEWIMLKYCLNF